MKEEEDTANMNTSTGLANDTQAFEKEFIKLYESLPVLWDTKHPDYTNKYKRSVANDAMLKIMKKWDSGATRATVRMKINVLRSCYRKDLRKYLKSKIIGPDGEESYEYNPKNWKFYALRFLGGKVNEEVERVRNSSHNSFIEINLDNTNFEDDASEESGNDEASSHTGDALQTFNDDKIYNQSKTKKIKRLKVEDSQDYVEDVMFDKELEAVSANVAYKLKRMNPDQRCHAELLINKVLIGGLKNSLTDETDLTEVYK